MAIISCALQFILVAYLENYFWMPLKSQIEIQWRNEVKVRLTKILLHYSTVIQASAVFFEQKLIPVLGPLRFADATAPSNLIAGSFIFLWSLFHDHPYFD